MGQNIEVHIKGGGKQTVVIQTGMTCSFYDWLPIIKSFHSTLQSFHTIAQGKSELGNQPRTIRQVTKELHMLLNKLAIQEPFILIGHSYGGLCAQHFAMLHEDKSQALILVDSTSMNLHRLDELHLPISDQTDSDDMWLEKYNTYSKMDVDTLYNELKPILTASIKTANWILYSRLHYIKRQLLNYRRENCALSLKELCKTLEIPLIVIGRDPQYSITQLTNGGMPKEEATQLEAMWQELIHEQLQLSIHSHIYLPNMLVTESKSTA